MSFVSVRTKCDHLHPTWTEVIVATIERRIHFYKLHHFVDPGDGGALELAAKPKDIYESIRKLPADYDADPNRYMPLSDGNELIMEIAEITPTRIKGRFASKRRRGLPQIEEAGAYTNLTLAAKAGLAEIRHFIYYPKTGRLGIEVNGTGPTISRFAAYLMRMSDEVDLVVTDMILSGTAAQLLQRVTRIAGASLTVHLDNAAVLDGIDKHLGAGLRELNKVDDNATQVTVAFELGSRKRDESLDLGLKSKLSNFLKKKENREALDDLTIRGYDQGVGYTRDIDLLEDKFIGIRKVVTLDPDGRVVDSDGVYAAIEDVAQHVP
jgi:hypothetical protein